MKIYTKSGDRGETRIVGARLLKTDARIEAIGAVDELNSSLGFAIYCCKKHGLSQLTEELIVLSHQLFDAGADLAQATEADWKITSAIPMRWSVALMPIHLSCRHCPDLFFQEGLNLLAHCIVAVQTPAKQNEKSTASPICPKRCCLFLTAYRTAFLQWRVALITNWPNKMSSMLASNAFKVRNKTVKEAIWIVVANVQKSDKRALFAGLVLFFSDLKEANMVGLIDFVRRIGIVLVLGLAICLLFFSFKSPAADEVIVERNIERQK